MAAPLRSRGSRVVALLLAVLPAAASTRATEVESVLLPPAATTADDAPSAPRLAAGAKLAPLATLSAAEVGARDQLEALAAWNREGRLPVRNGFARPLPSPQRVRLLAATADSPRARAIAGGVAA